MTAETTVTETPADRGTGAVGVYVRDYLGRLRGGDIGSLPAVGGLLVLCILFAVLRPSFFSALNFANLFTQGAAVAVIAMGLVFVLLLGEIDLSAGFASGVCAAVMAVLMAEHGAPWPIGLLAAILTGTVIGTVLGYLVAKVGIPSFVVTLAAFLAFQGAVLVIIGEGGNVGVHEPVLVAIANGNLPVPLGWAVYVLGVLAFAGVLLADRRVRRRGGLPVEPVGVLGARIATVAVVTGAAVYVLNLERAVNPAFRSLKGVPIVVPVILVLLILGTVLLNRTSYGRHLYATGGNAEAARRAGIPIDRIRISAFMLCSTLAAIGGIIAASRANSVDPNAGGSNTLLYAVGAAVIGGTSLFGGKGRLRDAILGGAVVAVIDNGMGLLGYSAGVKFIVTGSVLLVAAGVDALSRRRAAATGRG
ncbi:MAG TPA: ABC transporter permease [Mycobacteriales bacterium]|nr:inner-rane translocator [Cryptosporangiaceae bacterium]MDQ1678593.1 D-xylose transport system permease protein [Actinomycetota bacterium]HEV7756581.1 ABC transporter permease [Mycobacteriales bacterium]